MASYNYNQGGHNHGGIAGGSVNPNELSVPGSHAYGNSNGFSSGAAAISDDDLANIQGSDYNINGVNMGGFQPSLHSAHMNAYSNTPEGEPIQSPFVSVFSQPQFQQIQRPFSASIQSPVSYTGSPHAGLSQAQAQAMQRKASGARSPLTPNMASLHVGSHESQGFNSQAIRNPNAHHENMFASLTPNSAPRTTTHSNPLSYTQSQYGVSLPPHVNTVGGGVAQAKQQEDKRRKRRESHNAVERRRRDNINERIHDLSKLVPLHRLEDDKVRKAIQSGGSPSEQLGHSGPSAQPSSAMAGLNAKRPTGAGNITTGIPADDKDKAPNKGDILNGAVSWTRDLMWMLNMKLQQQEELFQAIEDLGGIVPFELLDDEKRMQTELMEAIASCESHSFNYSRAAGSGLRVPHHTNYKGDPLTGSGSATESNSISPNDRAIVDRDHDLDFNTPGDFLVGFEEHEDYNNMNDFKEEDEFTMDMN